MIVRRQIQKTATNFRKPILVCATTIFDSLEIPTKGVDRMWQVKPSMLRKKKYDCTVVTEWESGALCVVQLHYCRLSQSVPGDPAGLN